VFSTHVFRVLFFVCAQRDYGCLVFLIFFNVLYILLCRKLKHRDFMRLNFVREMGQMAVFGVQILGLEPGSDVNQCRVRGC